MAADVEGVRLLQHASLIEFKLFLLQIGQYLLLLLFDLSRDLSDVKHNV